MGWLDHEGSSGSEHPGSLGWILVLRSGSAQDAAEALETSGVGVVSPWSDAPDASGTGSASIELLPRLGVVLVRTGAESMEALATGENTPFIAKYPVRRLQIVPQPGIDALDPAAGSETGAEGQPAEPVTWGLKATGAHESQFTGRGVRVCVLDTGLDDTHPDFVGRAKEMRSFVKGQRDVRDLNGHGTHCAGIICGPLLPAEGPRFGIAHEAELYVAKVANREGDGTDCSVLCGLEWALSKKCRVASLSMGKPVGDHEPVDACYERIGARALAQGMLIVAAAGNGSDRRATTNRIRPVDSPANARSILAVGAIRQDLTVATFSNRGVNPDGGEIDVVGPGSFVRSTWSTIAVSHPARYADMFGTSMATPHAAGIAALLCEADPAASAATIRERLFATAQPLLAELPEDVGHGLVQAPQ